MWDCRISLTDLPIHEKVLLYALVKTHKLLFVNYLIIIISIVSAKVIIALTVTKCGTRNIVLHSKGLNIDSVKIGNENASFELDPDYELLTIKKTDNTDISLGNGSVEIEFNGDMKNRIVGLYTSSYKSATGENR